jgi:hypothetical protein
VNLIDTPAPAVSQDMPTHEALAVLEQATSHNLIDPAAAKDAKDRASFSPLSMRAVAALIAAGPAPGMALDAIAPAFLPGDVIELRALDPAGGGAQSLSGRLDVPEERKALCGFIARHNGLWNLYVGANPRRADFAGTDRAASAADVVARRGVVLDLDLKDAPSADPDRARTVADLLALGPVLALDSGNGFQIWLDVDAAGLDLEATVAPVAVAMAQLGADNTADLPRIMRLPYTVNLPTTVKRRRGNVPKLAAPLPRATPVAQRSKAPTVEALCATLGALATQLVLPGKASPNPGTGAGARTGDETPWAAPSADLLRQALAAMPADQGRFDRAEWIDLAHAVKGAAVAGGFEAEGREIWMDWCAPWGGDPYSDAAAWDGIKGRIGTGWGTIMKALERVNPAGREALRDAEARAAFANEAAVNIAAFNLMPFGPVADFDPRKIPPRKWLQGLTVLGSNLTLIVAAGGTGKSALVMVKALAMASGRELIPGDKPHHAMTVWYHNGEDDQDEQLRRLAAVMMHHGVSHADLGGRLILTSGRDRPIKLARQGKNGPEPVPGVADDLVARARACGAEVIVLDPLGAVHGLPENDNAAANLLLDSLRDIMGRAKVALVVLHHVGKAAATDMAAAGAGAARGASALVDGARIVLQLAVMTTGEAKDFGVSAGDRKRYIRVDNGKQNMSRAADASWLKLVSVKMGNATAAYPAGDDVAAVEGWTPPAIVSATMSELALVQAALGGTPPPQLSVVANDWIGARIAAALGLDIGPPGTGRAGRTDPQAANYRRVSALLKDWLASGGLREVLEYDPEGRKKHKFVRVGTPAILTDTVPTAGEDE